jgi:hypothetical protein
MTAQMSAIPTLTGPISGVSTLSTREAPPPGARPAQARPRPGIHLLARLFGYYHLVVCTDPEGEP